MCPACIATTLMVVAGTASAGGFGHIAIKHVRARKLEQMRHAKQLAQAGEARYRRVHADERDRAHRGSAAIDPAP